MERIGVIGCGIMGTGIAELTLQKGYAVVVHEMDQASLDRGVARVQADFERMEQKGKITFAEREHCLGRLSATLSVDDLSGCDLVIEAIVEDLAVKKTLFSSLDEACGRETIFASNTSSLSITEMAASTSRRDRFVGLHFFNPAAAMPLVEVTRTIITSPAVTETVIAFVRSLDKTPIIARDNAGFVVNLLMTPFLLDAMRCAEQGVASVQDIDLAMKLGCNHPMGPLMLADFIGLDQLFSGSSNMYEEYRDRRYAPPPILKKLLFLGELGQKTGRGFYDWSDLRNPVPRDLSF